MILCDFHVHTTFCDGSNTPEEMVIAAIEKGITRLGFSGHAHTPFDERYCMSVEGVQQYREKIRELKEKYRGKIEILCGLEQDLYADPPAEGYDYLIGSVHYLKNGDCYSPLDETPALLKETAARFYRGDPIALAEDYFAAVAALSGLKPMIIGHFDLIAKFNEGSALFDEEDPRYLSAAKAAVDALLLTGALFEVNTGAMARGYRRTPYPGKTILSYIIEKGGRLILSSDAHAAGGLLHGFAKAVTFARAAGPCRFLSL